MSKFRLPRWHRDGRRSQGGASAVEYGLLIAGIAALIAVAVFAFGGGTNGLFHGSCSTIFEDNPGQTTGQCN
jgi:pilus assembly protein Flp/PilA